MNLDLIKHNVGPMYTFIDIFLSYLIIIGPFILVALTINAFLSKWVKKQWIFQLASKFGHISLVRYILLPFISLFAMTNPSCYEVGNQLKEKDKPAFYDAAVSLCHPVTGLFPYSNSGELFFLIGALYPVIKLDISLFEFGITYFMIGLIIIFIRATVTEFLTKQFIKSMEKTVN